MSRFNVFQMFFSAAIVFLFFPVKPSFAACPVNMVQVGPVCVDEYEASVWSQPPNVDGTPQGIQYGVASDDYGCIDNGNDCSDPSLPAGMIFAASVPGVKPSAYITWFQAQQACANVGKGLLRNGVWQMAAAGTPDTSNGSDNGTTGCNITLQPNSDPVLTGSRSNCVSNWGVFDMVGNVAEWVEDWMQPNSLIDGLNSSSSAYRNDGIFRINDAYLQSYQMGFAGAFPAALVRGGSFANTLWSMAGGGIRAGVFALSAFAAPAWSSLEVGFRCATQNQIVGTTSPASSE